MENYMKEMYEKCYQFVVSKDCPIVIPSYNRYNSSDSIRMLGVNDSSDFHYQVFVVVRSSQKSYYEKNCNYSNVTILDFEDSEIDNIGKTRRKIQEYFSKKYSTIIMMDDDISWFSYLYKRENSKGNIYSFMDKESNPHKSFACFQYVNLILRELYPNNILTGCLPSIRTWSTDFSDSENSVRFLKDSTINVEILNLDKMSDYNISYKDNNTHGHEDSDLLLQILKNHAIFSCFKGVTFSIRKMDSTFGYSSVDERFKIFWDRIMNNYPELKENNLIRIKESNPLHPSISWKKCNKYYNNGGIIIPDLDIYEEFKRRCS